MTTSSDCTARIFGLDGSNPRTLTGHRRGVTSSYMIGKGREVLTSSSDGTTRLWDVGEGIQKRVFPSHSFSSVNVVSMGRKEVKGQDGMELDVASNEDKLLVTGLSNGFIEGHDVLSGSSVFRLPKLLFPSGTAPQATDRWKQITSGSISSLDWSRDSNLLVAGCINGVTLAHDVRMISSESNGSQDNGGAALASRSLLATWRRNEAAINEIRLLPGCKEAILATSDGTPYRVNLVEDSPRVLEEYNGWDVDNVQSSCIDARGRIWLAGADGFLRMY